MKTIRTIIRLCSAVVIVSALNTANGQTALEYLNKMPKFPDSVCSCSKETMQQYAELVNDLKEKVADDAGNRKNQFESYIEGNKGSMEDGMMQRVSETSGLSMEEIQKLKDKQGDLTQAEKDALADRVLQNQNLSLDEVKNMQNMTKEGQEAWAQAYAAEQMANAQANQGQNAKMAQQNNQAASMLSLMEEQQSVQGKIRNYEMDVINRKQALMDEAGREKAALDSELKKLVNELHSIRSIYECNECGTPPQADVNHWNAVVKKIHEMQKSYRAYCEKFTPKLEKYLNWYKESLVGNLPLYDKAEELQIQTTAATTNTNLSLPANAKGSFSLQAVENYMSAYDLFIFSSQIDLPDFQIDYYK